MLLVGALPLPGICLRRRGLTFTIQLALLTFKISGVEKGKRKGRKEGEKSTRRAHTQLAHTPIKKCAQLYTRPNH